MFAKKINVNQVDTIVGAGTRFDGNIEATGMVRIDGKMTGEIKTQGDVVVGEDGEVTAKITGRNVTVAGRVNGNITASERLQILPSGQLIGDVEVNKIVIEEGARFSGQCIMTGDKEKVDKEKSKNQNHKK